jgi:replicative DNA helicase
MDRTLEPANLEAERSLLGSVLIDQDALSVVSLAPEAFYRQAHQLIYKAMRNLWDNQRPVDYTLLAYELQKTGKLEEVGGYAYLTDLVSATPTAMYAQHYAKVVEDNYRLRRYIAMSQEGVKRAYENTNPSELAAWYAEQLKQIEHGAVESPITFWEDSFPEFQAMLDKKADDLENGIAGWPWPWDLWNHFFGDAQAGMVIYVAGATGMGKTAFAENVAEHWAKQGHRTVFVHLELNKEIMYARRAARHTGIDSRLILNKKLNREQREVVNRADAKMLTWEGVSFGHFTVLTAF